MRCAGAASAEETGHASWPHDYPGMPSGDYSPAWQSYYQVKDPLPNVTFHAGQSWAGNILVEPQTRPNDSLFFWGFEKDSGSLTRTNSDEPWAIWLSGGSVLAIVLGRTGAKGSYAGRARRACLVYFSRTVLFTSIRTTQRPKIITLGQHSRTSSGLTSPWVWDTLQWAPVVTFATKTPWLAFLANLVKVFPTLATRPLYLMGESYAGTYIPYIVKTYFSLQEPPVRLAKIAIGDGAISNVAEFQVAPVINVIETYPQLIGYDPAVYEAFKAKTHACGFDLNLTYPQVGYFPALNFTCGGICDGQADSAQSSRRRRPLKGMVDMNYAARRYRQRDHTPSYTTRDELRTAWTRDLVHADDVLDPWYLCDLFDEFIDYAVNYTFPWNISMDAGSGFNVYDVPDALDPEAILDIEVFMNDPRTVKALHAPTIKSFAQEVFYDFGLPSGDPSPSPMGFFTEMATNLSQASIPVVIYSGNDDALVSHWGSEVVIQNTTFGGVQGFSRKPSTPWTSDNGSFAGIVHQERSWTYVLVYGAGHQVPLQNPPTALTLFREFILGNNQTGLVTNASADVVTIVGGSGPALQGINLPGAPEIYYGSGRTMSTYVAPSATIAAWKSFVATAIATAAPTRSA